MSDTTMSDTTMSDTTIVLIRHGETLGESSIRLNGITDVALSPLGIRQMERATTVLAGHDFERVVSSPMRRSREGNAIVRGTRSPEIVPNFREMNFGNWETWTWAEVEARDPTGFRTSRAAKADFQFPGGESRFGFYDRVKQAALDTFSSSTQSTV
ncbi:MAG: broad specificity phosphatase PhoE, partial [Myxococcota bacterium]